MERAKPKPKPGKPRPRNHYFARVSYAGPNDLVERAPELRPLAGKSVAVFGVGCIGAPSALEFARTGVGELRLMDGDYVDAGTILRWPFGIPAVGSPKVDVIRDIVRAHYPYTRIEVALPHHLGGVRIEREERSDLDAVRRMTDGISLMYDATAEWGVQYYLSDLARQLRIPYVGVAGRQGGWGGYVARIVPGRTAGCRMCLEYAWRDESIPRPPTSEHEFVQPTGCANPTFLATGFDMTHIALHGVRGAVSTLCGGHEGAYPDPDWDVLILGIRSDAGDLVPSSQGFRLARHPDCLACAGS